MIAGLLAVFGNCGERPGALMRRGTIVLGGEAASLSPTFVESGPVELVLLHLLATELKDALPPSHLAPLKGRVRKLAGDMAVLGKGEILQAGGLIAGSGVGSIAPGRQSRGQSRRITGRFCGAASDPG